MPYLLVLAGMVMAAAITDAQVVEWYMPCVLWLAGIAFGASVFNT